MLIVASLTSLLIIGVAIVIVFFLMRRLGDVPARTYNELKQDEKQEEKSTAL